MGIKLRTVENPVQSWKTSSPAGGASFPTFRILQDEFWSCFTPDPVPEPEQCSFSLLFLWDSLYDREFLVDLGASNSIFPGPRSNSSKGVWLLTADGSLMVCSGTKIIPLCFSCGTGSKVYTWTFQLAPVSVPLLEQISWGILISSWTSKVEKL